MQEFMKFPWEGDVEEHMKEMTNDDRERLKAKADEIAKILK